MVAGRRLDRPRAARRRGRRWVDAADRGAPADPHLLRRAPRRRRADQNRPRAGRSGRRVRRSASGCATARSPTRRLSRPRSSSGQGLDDLKAALARVLAATPPPRDIGKPRLPVDRVFTLPGIGTVVTGTLFGGTLRRGQSVVHPAVRQDDADSPDPVARPGRRNERAGDADRAQPGRRRRARRCPSRRRRHARGAWRPERVPRRAPGDFAERRPAAQGRRPRARPSRQRQRGGARGAGDGQGVAAGGARSRSCGSRRRRSYSLAIASRCATGRSSTRWPARSSSIPTPTGRRSARRRGSSGSVVLRTSMEDADRLVGGVRRRVTARLGGAHCC